MLATKKETKNELTESLEKYLLAIFEIVEKNEAARVKDVAHHLNIKMPATSDAVKTLAKRGYINYVPYGIITLTEKGKQKAIEKNKRHEIISKFLGEILSVDKDKVEDSAKQIEYSVSDDVLEKFVNFLSFMDFCSCRSPKWLESFKYYSENNKVKEKCTACKNGGKTCCGGYSN